LEDLILISVVSTFCWDLHRAILFCATNLCCCSDAINRD